MLRSLLLISLLLLLAIANPAFAASPGSPDAISTGPGQGIVVPQPETTNPCSGSEFLLNGDGTYENGISWQYGGVVTPYYGALAEGYSATGTLCGLQLRLTTLPGYFQNQTLDAYVWDSNGFDPGNVLSVTTGVHIAQPGFWPSITTHDIDIQDASVNGQFYVGYWGNWPNQPAGWYVAADTDGPPSEVRTNIAPGIGYPTGWQDPSIVWGSVPAIGIGAYVLPSDTLNCVNAPAGGWLHVDQNYTGPTPVPPPAAPPCSYIYDIYQHCGGASNYDTVVMTILTPGVSIDINQQWPTYPYGLPSYDPGHGATVPDVTTQTITWRFPNGLAPFPGAGWIMHEPVFFTAINPSLQECVVRFQAFDNAPIPQTSAARTVILGRISLNNPLGPGDMEECNYGTCSAPPSGLTAWWPFDDVDPLGTTTLERFANAPSDIRGTTSAMLGEKFGNSLHFVTTGDYVETQTATGGYDIGANDFTIDAWIKTAAPEAAGRTIIQKAGWTPFFTGYTFYFWSEDPSSPGHEYLAIGMDDGSPGIVYAHSNALTISDGSWHFVMVTVSRSNPQVIKFWCDGLLKGTWPFSGVPNSFSNAGNATIANNPFGTASAFAGYIDEVEVFSRDLSKDPNFNSMEYGLRHGKCKDVSCTLAYSSMANGPSGQATTALSGACIYNYSASVCRMFWSVVGIPVGSPGGGTVNGPTSFTWPASYDSPITVSANASVFIPVTIPSGSIPDFNSSNIGATAGFRLTVYNECTGQASSCEGLVVNPGGNTPINIHGGRSGNGLITSGDDMGMYVEVPPNGSAPAQFSIQNRGNTPVTVHYSIAASLEEPDSVALNGIHLNGLPAGTPVSGSVALAPHDSTVVSVDVSFTRVNPFKFFDIILATDQGNGGPLILKAADLVRCVGFDPAGIPPLGTSEAASFKLRSVWPNPSGGQSSLRFEIPNRARLTVNIYDAGGRMVRHLGGDTVEPGDRTVVWDGLTDTHQKAPAGVYFARATLEGRDRSMQGRIVILR